MATAIIADDERMMRDQLRSRIEQVWPELEILAEAKNGEEAVQLVLEHQPDLIFLDIRMPVKPVWKRPGRLLEKPYRVHHSL